MHSLNGMNLAGRIIKALRHLGVAPIPRNYQLMYEAYTGGNLDLTRELNSLDVPVKQSDLDKIARRYSSEQGAEIINEAGNRVNGQLDGLLRLLKKEQASLDRYNRLLEETCSRITSKNSVSADLVHQALELLSAATDEKYADGERTVSGIAESSVEMAKVKTELEEYKRIANTDPLTQLSNRRAFDAALDKLFADPKRTDYSALILADIDHFKRINDTFGHPVGDRILSIVAGVLKASLRPDALLARTGGEEFAIILTETSLEVAEAVAERIRATIAATPLRNRRTSIDYGSVTVSLGLCMGTDSCGPESLYNNADLALYSAKKSGRNRVVVYHQEMNADSQSMKLIYKKTV